MTPATRSRSSTPVFRASFLWRQIVGGSLASSPSPTRGARSRTAPSAGAGSAVGSLAVPADGRRLPACGVFGAAGEYSD